MPCHSGCSCRQTASGEQQGLPGQRRTIATGHCKVETSSGSRDDLCRHIEGLTSNCFGGLWSLVYCRRLACCIIFIRSGEKRGDALALAHEEALHSSAEAWDEVTTWRCHPGHPLRRLQLSHRCQRLEIGCMSPTLQTIYDNSAFPNILYACTEPVLYTFDDWDQHRTEGLQVHAR